MAGVFRHFAMAQTNHKSPVTGDHGLFFLSEAKWTIFHYSPMISYSPASESSSTLILSFSAMLIPWSSYRARHVKTLLGSSVESVIIKKTTTKNH